MDIQALGALLILVLFILFFIFRTSEVAVLSLSAVLSFAVILAEDFPILVDIGQSPSSDIKAVSTIVINNNKDRSIEEVEGIIENNIKEYELSEFSLEKDTESKIYIIKYKKDCFSIKGINMYRETNFPIPYKIIDGTEYILQ